MSRGQRDEPLRPYSRFSRPSIAFFSLPNPFSRPMALGLWLGSRDSGARTAFYPINAGHHSLGSRAAGV
jgi:hypothetical protein